MKDEVFYDGSKNNNSLKEASWKVNCDIKWLEAFRVSSCRPLLISVSFFTKLYNVLWEHHKFIALIGQLTYYQNLNVSTGQKNRINHSNQLKLTHYMAFTYLDWLPVSRKDRNFIWEQRHSKHNRIGFGTSITVYVTFIQSFCSTTFISGGFREPIFLQTFLTTGLSYHKPLFHW